MTDPKQNEKRQARSGDSGEAEVQRKFDEINEQGYQGVRVDPTPQENYTVAGVVAGKPTPETDDEQADKAGAALKKIERTNPAEGDRK